MGLTQRIKSAIIERFGLTNHEVVRRVLSRETDSGESVSGTSVLGISAAWACTNLLAGTIGSLPLTVYRRSGDDRLVDRGHPLYRLLAESPNFDQTALDFWEFAAASLELWGNAYARIVREGSRVVGLEPIAPDGVVVRRDRRGFLEYSWSENGEGFVETDETVLHIRGFGGSPLGGMSTLQFARHSFGLAQAVDRAASKTFKNGIRPTGGLKFAEWLSAEQRELAETRLTEKFLGAENNGRPMILEGGVDWVPFSLNPEDAQMLESRRFSVEEVCRFFGVPPHMIGHTEKSSSWGTGLEQQTLGFQKFTLRRRLKRIEQALMKQLLTPADRARGVYIEFNLEGLLRADSAGRAGFYSTMTQIGAMTINEVRRLENLPPVQGGDVPRMQIQNVPIAGTGAIGGQGDANA